MKAARNERIGPCGSGREQFLKNIENRVLPSLRAFKPELIILSAGFDAAKDDVGNVKLDTGKGGIDLSTKGEWDSCCTCIRPPPPASHCFSFLLALTPFFPLFLNTCLDYEILTQRFQDVAKMCGHNKIVSCLEGGYGKWARGKNGTTVLDRSLLAENVSSHVHSLVGVQPLRARKDSRSKREGKKSR
jgi:acetoin utilization deacetylase AcuC-like enzyme